jgi:hypothetical protein
MVAYGVILMGPVTEMRSEERLAFALARRVLAATVDPYDVDGRQRAVDAMVYYQDGRTAALEVSSIGAEGEAGILQYLGSRGHCKNVPGLKHRWLVEVPRNFHPAEMRKVETALRWCEERGLEHLNALYGVDRDMDALITQGVRANIVARSGSGDSHESRVYFVLQAMGGCPGRGMASLADELADVLRTPTMQSKLEKLAATGMHERHLVLIVRPSAFSFPVYDGLAFGGPLPGARPHLPEGLSQVWLITGIRAGGVVRGITGGGWYRDHPYDDAPA